MGLRPPGSPTIGTTVSSASPWLNHRLDTPGEAGPSQDHHPRLRPLDVSHSLWLAGVLKCHRKQLCIPKVASHVIKSVDMVASLRFLVGTTQNEVFFSCLSLPFSGIQTGKKAVGTVKHFLKLLATIVLFLRFLLLFLYTLFAQRNHYFPYN